MKIKLWINLSLLAVLVLPSACLAVDGKVSFGSYQNQQNVRSRPDGGLAEYQSEIEIGHRMGLFTGQIRPFVNLITLMDDYNDNGSFHPASINYSVGLGWEKQITGQLFFFTTVKHFCWHAIDTNGPVAQANYFEVGFRF